MIIQLGSVQMLFWVLLREHVMKLCACSGLSFGSGSVRRSSGHRRIRLRREVLGFRRDGLGAACLQNPAAVWMVSVIPTFHYWLYPVWLCMWRIIQNLEPCPALRLRLQTNQTLVISVWAFLGLGIKNQYLKGQESDTCCKIKISIPPINSCVRIFYY